MENTRDPEEMLDRLLDQMERGRPTVAAHQLVGMLDAAVTDMESAARWKAALACHPISEMFAFDRVADAPAAGGALQAALDALDFHAASALRLRLAKEAVRGARQRRQRILLLDEGGKANGEQASAGAYDVIVAAFAIGWIAPDQLAGWIGCQSGQLAPGGQLLVSSFLPSHIGRGWRRLQPQAEPYSHDEDTIRAAARLHGLELRYFRDAANCIAWCQIIRPSEGNLPGGQNHDQ